MTFTWLVTALAMLPVFHEDRGEALATQKAAELRDVAAAVAEVAKDDRWRAAMLLAWGNHETHFSSRIGRGECADYECDPFYTRGGRRISRKAYLAGGGEVHHQSISYWQLKVRGCSSAEAWLAAHRDVRVAAREAARILDRMRGSCRKLEREGHDPARMVFNRLGGRGCLSDLPDVAARVNTFRRLMGAKGAM